MYIFCTYRSVFCKMLLFRLPMTVKLTVVFHNLICCWASQEKYSREMDSRNGSCPPWYYHDDEDKCSFSHQLPQIVNQYGNTSELEMGYCMTQTNSNLVVTGCSYIIHNFSQQHSIYQVLPKQLDQVNDSLCGTFNRKGFLCSECKENYGLAAYRYYGLTCVKCSGSAWNWVAYILLLFVPPTILFVVLLIVNMFVSYNTFCGFAYCQHKHSLRSTYWIYLRCPLSNNYYLLFSCYFHTLSKSLWILAWADSIGSLWNLES